MGLTETRTWRPRPFFYAWSTASGQNRFKYRLCATFCRDTRQRYKNLLARFLVEDDVLTEGRRFEFFNTHSNAYEAFYRIAPKHIPNRMDFENIEGRNH